MRKYDLQAASVSEDSVPTRDSVPPLSEATDESGQEKIEDTRITIIDVMDFGH